MVFRLGLEGMLLRIPTPDFYEILDDCVPGPNRTQAKANRMRAFKVPARFFKKELENVTVTCLAALVCKDFSWVLCDHDRLAQLYLFSKATPWLESDLQTDSQVSLGYS